MKKSLIPLLILAGFAQAFAAPAPKSSPLKLTFGWVRGPDGVKRSVKGLELQVGEVIKLDPSQVKRVRIWKDGKVNRKPILTRPPKRTLADVVENLMYSNMHANTTLGGMVAEQVVFSTRTDNYYILDSEFADPSTLDDIVMSAGSGKLWKRIWVGIDVSDAHDFLIRWQIFQTALSGTGPDESAFADILGPNNFIGEPAGDFGGIENPDEWPGYTGPGSYLVPFDLPNPSILWPGINCPSNTIYMAQQFREPQANGEGAFDSSYKTVYSALAAPTVGTSQDGFWYDWEAQNGIYSSNEFEVLGDIDGQPVSFSNICREIVVSGSVANLGPLEYTIVFGIPISGSNIDLQDSDNEYVKFGPFYNVARTDPYGRIEFLSVAPATNANGFKFHTEIGASIEGGTLTTELYNYNSGAFELFDTRTIPASDTLVEVTVPSNYSRYINATNKRVRARLNFFSSSNVNRSYQYRVDKAGWTITYP